MLKRILPAHVDNRFRGHVLALWLFAPLTLMKLALGLVHILRADGGAQSVSTMPLDTYPAGAAQNIIALMARMGLEQVLLGALFLLVLLRYRALVPLMYLVAVAHFALQYSVAAMKPLALAGTSGASTMHLIIGVASGIGLLLSLSGRGYRRASVGR
ncbi:hypothetical protein [Lysobacter solisilvae (ex Woo and Kim 2020)]|uniref:DoxX family protein n=1 Tax=Agrilutibacter terrestris TaxID=2865112 RepID=A0A7H0G070_9GAMM|nr:hypothetical protein [Lysobacter terrestris]QNP41686.1 hypothetical protein H8B22_05625 [Lysobacter terrestris]